MLESKSHQKRTSQRPIKGIRHDYRKQAGAVFMISVLVVLPILMACAMLAIDLSRLILERAELRRAADAAAFAGAAALRSAPTDKTAAELASNNAIKGMNLVVGKYPLALSGGVEAGCVDPSTKVWTTGTRPLNCTTPNLRAVRVGIRNATRPYGFSLFFGVTRIRDQRVSSIAAVIPGSTSSAPVVIKIVK